MRFGSRLTEKNNETIIASEAYGGSECMCTNEKNKTNKQTNTAARSLLPVDTEIGGQGFKNMFEVRKAESLQVSCAIAASET